MADTQASGPFETRAATDGGRSSLDLSAIGLVLAQANGFKLDALPDNRAGRLGSTQIPRLQDLGRKRKLRGLVVVLFGCCLIALGPYGYLRDRTDAIVAIGLAFVGVVVIGLGWRGWFSTSMKDAMTAGRVEQIEGFVRPVVITRRDAHDGRESTEYYYDLRDRHFEVIRDAYDVIVPGLRYRAYYLPTADGARR